jgi:hypothetical protein
MRYFPLILAFLAALPAIAQPATQPAITPPDRTIAIQKDVALDVLGFSADGKALYLQADVDQVHVLALLLYYWPEAAAALPALLVLRWFVRVARVRQFPGEEHCRRCNYLLKNLPSPRCPECGTELTPRNRIPGRQRWPRLAIATALLLGLVATYHLCNARLPRTGRAGEWLDWRSIRLAKWAEEGKVAWITRHTTHDRLVLLARVDGGGIRKVCRIQLDKGTSQPFFCSVLSADHRFQFSSTGEASDAWPTGVLQIDLASGRILRRFSAGNAVPCVSTEGASRTLFIAGRTDDGKSGLLRAFDIASGRRLHDLADARSVPGFAMPASDRDLAIVTANGGDIVRVWDPISGEVLQSFLRTGRVCCLNAGILYEAGTDTTGLHVTAHEILSRKRTNLLTLDPARPFGIAVSHDTLVVACGDAHRSTAFAVNLKTGERREWAISDGAQLALSPDARTLAIYGDGSIGKGILGNSIPGIRSGNPPGFGSNVCDKVDIYSIPWK